MKINKLIRDIHHWGSIIVAVPIIIMIGAGVLLMLKKEFDWIQPPTQRGAGIDIASDGHFEAQSLQALFETARQVKPSHFTKWSELARVDIKPGHDVVKFVSKSNWEVQIDLKTGEVLQIAYRRSDLIESIHDGSFFASWAKLWIFFPATLVLFILWVTGMYLFALPHIKKFKKKRKNPQIDQSG